MNHEFLFNILGETEHCLYTFDGTLEYNYKNKKSQSIVILEDFIENKLLRNYKEIKKTYGDIKVKVLRVYPPHLGDGHVMRTIYKLSFPTEESLIHFMIVYGISSDCHTVKFPEHNPNYIHTVSHYICYAASYHWNYTEIINLMYKMCQKFTKNKRTKNYNSLFPYLVVCRLDVVNHKTPTIFKSVSAIPKDMTIEHVTKSHDNTGKDYAKWAFKSFDDKNNVINYLTSIGLNPQEILV
jgi:hypothetical protein